MHTFSTEGLLRLEKGNVQERERVTQKQTFLERSTLQVVSVFPVLVLAENTYFAASLPGQASPVGARQPSLRPAVPGDEGLLWAGVLSSSCCTFRPTQPHRDTRALALCVPHSLDIRSHQPAKHRAP